MAKQKKSATKPVRKGKKPVVATRKPVRRSRRAEGDQGGFLVLAVMALLAIAVIQPVVAGVILVGITPSLVMSFTDQHALKNARIQCVSLLNLTGVLPFAYRVYERPDIWQETLVDAVTMVVMWGSAAIGYLILYLGPVIASIVLQAMSQDKLKSIAQQRQDLIEQWGVEVLGDPEDTSKPKDNFIRPKKS